MNSKAVSIFISYSKADLFLMQEMEKHLEPLRLNGLSSSWHSGCISPGDEWELQIEQKLDQAQVILILISADFIKTDFCYEVEMSKAIKRHKNGDACVIPIILRSCMWQEILIEGIKLVDLQVIPKNLVPVNEWTSLDEAFTHIAKELFDKIRSIQQKWESNNDLSTDQTKSYDSLKSSTHLIPRNNFDPINLHQRKTDRLQRDIKLAQDQSNDLTEVIELIQEEIKENRGDLIRLNNLKKKKARYENERDEYDKQVERIQGIIDSL